jgi:hypothetical protein
MPSRQNNLLTFFTHNNFVTHHLAFRDALKGLRQTYKSIEGHCHHNITEDSFKRKM